MAWSSHNNMFEVTNEILTPISVTYCDQNIYINVLVVRVLVYIIIYSDNYIYIYQKLYEIRISYVLHDNNYITMQSSHELLTIKKV